MLQRVLILSWSAPLHSLDNHKRPAGTCNKHQDWIQIFHNHHGGLPSNHISKPITIPRRYIDEHQGIYNTSIKDKRHTTNMIKYAIQVKVLSERDRFTVIVNNSFTKQHKYHLLNKLQYDQKQYGRPSKMADISIWQTFKNGGLSTKKPNMAGISILQIFQFEERYLNTAIRIATPH